jgi:hypothetical protein
MLAGAAEVMAGRAVLLPFGLLIFLPFITSALASFTGSADDVTLTVRVVVLVSASWTSCMMSASPDPIAFESAMFEVRFSIVMVE